MIGAPTAVVPDMAYPQFNSYQTSFCNCPECMGYTSVESGHTVPYDSSIAPPTPLLPQSPIMHTYTHDPYSTVSYCSCEGCTRSTSYISGPQMHHVSHPFPAPVERRISVEKSSRVAPVQYSQILGNMYEMAKTAHGSSYIQACLRDFNPERFRDVCKEILPHGAELLLDTHGCYVVRTLMEQMPQNELVAFVKTLSVQEDVVLALCTNSLHTRRIVQFFLERLSSEECEFLVDIMIKRCTDISRTQQGCIVIQRVLECAVPEKKKVIFDIVQRNVTSFSMDPYANYVVQYMFEMGNKESNSECIRNYFAGSVSQLACDKYASNVVEKALHFATPDAQHALVEELYNVGPDRLIAMIQDSYGNYIIQATIALCSFRDVWMIAERLNPVLHLTPYGYKIASKLERRLKGKALNSVHV